MRSSTIWLMKSSNNSNNLEDSAVIQHDAVCVPKGFKMPETFHRRVGNILGRLRLSRQRRQIPISGILFLVVLS